VIARPVQERRQRQKSLDLGRRITRRFLPRGGTMGIPVFTE